MNFFGQNRLQFLTSFLEIDAFSEDYYDYIQNISENCACSKISLVQKKPLEKPNQKVGNYLD